MDTDRSIARPWASGDHQHPGPSSELRMGLSHEGSATFMAADDKADARVTVKTVKHREIALAGDAENRIDPLDGERIGNDVASAAHRQDAIRMRTVCVRTAYRG